MVILWLELSNVGGFGRHSVVSDARSQQFDAAVTPRRVLIVDSSGDGARLRVRRVRDRRVLLADRGMASGHDLRSDLALDVLSRRSRSVSLTLSAAGTL
jgi:hypothetical protein